MRKTIDIAIDGDNRDAGKVFRITELPALRAERFAARLLLGMVSEGFDIPEAALRQGMAGLAPIILKALATVRWELAEELMGEMLQCVTVVVEAAPNGRRLIDADIEEVSTLIRLRKAWVELHTGFSLAAAS